MRKPPLPRSTGTIIAMSKSVPVGLLVLGLLAANSPTAVEKLNDYLQQARATRKAGDMRAHLQVVLGLQDFLNHSPQAVESAAQAWAAAGDTEHALASLEEFTALGQADDALLAGKDQGLSSLRPLPQFGSILAAFRANETPHSAAKTAFTLPDPETLAEDIDFDPQSKTFLITSVLGKKILRVSFSGQASDFAQSPSHWPMVAVKVDAPHDLLWATEVAFDGFASAPKADWGKSAVLCFRLHTGALVQRIEGPPHASLGDMVLAPNGDPIVSDGDGGGVYRVAHGQMELIDGNDFISPQTSAAFPGNRIVVPDYVRGLGILDLSTRQVVWMNRDDQKKVALSGVDGLYFDRGSLILTQNGTSPERVIRVRLDSTLTHIVSADIIESATPSLDPTHGVVVGDSFFYIANSGWSHLDEHGDKKPGATFTPPRIMRFPLR